MNEAPNILKTYLPVPMSVTIDEECNEWIVSALDNAAIALSFANSPDRAAHFQWKPNDTLPEDSLYDERIIPDRDNDPLADVNGPKMYYPYRLCSREYDILKTGG